MGWIDEGGGEAATKTISFCFDLVSLFALHPLFVLWCWLVDWLALLDHARRR
jgi:hypothetical protein